MNLFSAIPVYIAVVESGGFSNAARKLNLSKAAVSKRISQLEDHLGVRLLQRTTRRLYLTEAGERYYEHASRALTAAKDAESAVMQMQSKPKGHLRVHTPMSFGHLNIAPLISEFLQQYPDIQIDMVMDDNIIDLMDGNFDIAFRAGEMPDSTFYARKLGVFRSVLCASPSYISCFGKPEIPEALHSHNCVFYSYSSRANEWTFSGGHEQQTVHISGNFQVNNSESLCRVIIDGTGIGRLPTFIANTYISSGELIPLLENYVMPSKPLYAVFKERLFLPEKVRVFLDFITEKTGENHQY
jgi:DNA-binding transcriptional LysR family regulator